jgi:hypothetical protein
VASEHTSLVDLSFPGVASAASAVEHTAAANIAPRTIDLHHPRIVASGAGLAI